MHLRGHSDFLKKYKIFFLNFLNNKNYIYNFTNALRRDQRILFLIVTLITIA